MAFACFVSPETTAPRAGAARPLPPRPANARYHSLDAWRGLACMLLVFHHTSFFVESNLNPHDPSSWSVAGWFHRLTNWGWVGVPLFFVISGYCISASIDSLRRKPHSMGSYAWRRVHRIYPPLIAGLAFAVLFILTMFLIVPTLDRYCTPLPHLDTLSVTDWIGNLTATESWLPRLEGGAPVYLMQNTWTLCYEEQFYIVTALMLFTMARRFFFASLVLSAAVLVGRHLSRQQGLDAAGFFFDGHWLMFAAGILLYHRLNYASRIQAVMGQLLLIAGMAYAYLDRRTAGSHFERHLDEYLFVACGLTLMLGWLKRWDAAVSGSLLARPLRWCGQRSFSIYLTHYPVVVGLSCWLHHQGFASLESWLLVVVPLCLLAALPVSLLFYHLIEKHFQNPGAV